MDVIAADGWDSFDNDSPFGAPGWLDRPSITDTVVALVGPPLDAWGCIAPGIGTSSAISDPRGEVRSGERGGSGVW